MLTQRYLIPLSLLVLSLAVNSAQLPDDIEPGDSVNEIQLPLTKQSAAELIRVEYQGKVLSVDKNKFKGKTIFRVKVLHDNGKIRFYRLDPLTGYAPH
ncbi:hypothetical protein A9Q79_10060 [Methylophaga sp. 42_25_T18]|nr:hypothetical protein A9Q79_10060 [Methylophaga sp. 42_25_T18]